MFFCILNAACSTHASGIYGLFCSRRSLHHPFSRHNAPSPRSFPKPDPNLNPNPQQAISRGITKAGLGVETLNLELTTVEEVETALEKASGFVLGSPTLGGHMPTPVGALFLWCYCLGLPKARTGLGLALKV